MDHILLQSLLRPEAFDDFTQKVALRQTHISYLFFTDCHVYKIKKPVDFGFLNFTSVDRRRFYCEEEVRLNRRLSPDVYLGVVEVRQNIEGATFSGDGQIIDYAVKMRRLPEERMLDCLVETGEVTETDLLHIASKVAQFHLSTERNAEISRFGATDSITRTWDENFNLAAQFIGETVSGEDIAILKEWVKRFLTVNPQLFADRIDGGFIRDCDGDLHLGNICVGEDVWIFDCIEFNTSFRYIDTASDIAFLLMDLDFHFRSDLGRIFLDEYCRQTSDFACLPIVEFYKVYRAFVRGKVAGLAMRDAAISQHERETARESSIAYFRLARGYVLRSALPLTLIMVGGMIGSGKSTLARNLGRELGVEVLSTDRLRKELFNPMNIRDQEFAQGIYSQEVDVATYGEMLHRALGYLQSGKSVIVDATFRRVSDREEFRQGAAAAGAALCLIFTDASEEMILTRLSAREEHPDRFSDGRTGIYAQIRAGFEWPDQLTEPYLAVKTSGTIWEGVDAVLARLGVIP
ncbi:putative protein [Geobacter sp. OR-1]|uniref:bifunctional aminoglycoside phosphotransferase/ATP-binding protein n=1 Tax=Geobacter sp. OR-1 TaxID=1266765 RepID=UPI000543E663|nr:AAA family ATPase [Geobacter sp. OR-1]GAM10621.1 putative protein [Geobacter sp. OR-1]